MASEKGLRRWSVTGAWFSAIYIVIVLTVYTLTALTTVPDNVGLDWIPFVMLAMPWYGMNAQLLIVGFVLNAAILYLLGGLVETVWRTVISGPRVVDR